MQASGTLPFVIARVHDMRLAISAEYVQQIVKVPRWHSVPLLPPYARGLMLFRGQAIPLIDLRLRLNMHSAMQDLDEMISMLNAREQDHVRWLEALELAIRDNTPFALARDPSKCAFGRWYDAFRSDDMAFGAIMSQFDAPHRVIHAIADTALEYVAQGHADKALALIESTRTGELREVRRLFAEARDTYTQSHNELALVLAVGGKVISVTVDHVESVEAVDEGTTDDMDEVLGQFRSDAVGTVCRRRNDKGFAFVWNPDQLFGT